MSLSQLKKEVDLLHKTLAVNGTPQMQDQTEKLLFYTEKLIELSQDPNPEKEARINREIDEFNAKHPFSPDDILRLEPYKSLFNECDR